MVVGDAAFYAALAQRPGYYEADKSEFRMARDYARPGEGLRGWAGIGLFRDHIPQAEFLGLEFNDTALEQAAARNVLVLRRELREFASGHQAVFDVTCAFQVLEHVAEPLEFVAALVQLTKPGGTILISTPNGESYISRNRDLLNAPPHHVTWWEDMTWIWLKEKFGLRSLKLHHTLVDEFLIEWARMVAVDGLAAMLGVPLRPVVDETPIRRRMSAMAEQTAMIIAHGIRHRMDVPHSVARPWRCSRGSARAIRREQEISPSSASATVGNRMTRAIIGCAETPPVPRHIVQRRNPLSFG